MTFEFREREFLDQLNKYSCKDGASSKELLSCNATEFRSSLKEQGQSVEGNRKTENKGSKGHFILEIEKTREFQSKENPVSFRDKARF
jgi:hypothetical protein